jgi:hypothetical protein
LLNVKHLQARIIRGNQVADVHVTDRDYSSERRSDTFEGDFLFEETKIGSKRFGVCFVRALRSVGVLGIKLGDDTFFV